MASCKNPNSVQINGDFYDSNGTHPTVLSFESNDDDLALATRSLSEEKREIP